MTLTSANAAAAHDYTRVRAFDYARVSLDKSGRERSQDEQHAENEAAREAHGWQTGGSYRDTGSASKHARKTRQDFDRLMADLRRGDAFARGDVLILWESSRGSRRQAEWATFLDLLEDNGMLVYVTSHGRLYDPAHPRDRRSLDEDGVDSAYESGKLSERFKRSQRQRAADGRPTGRCPFGYKRIYSVDDFGGRTFRQVPHPEEAPLVQELFERVAHGHSLYSIAKDWAERGVHNDSGRPFSPAHLRALLENDAYRGVRVHDPGRKGRKAGAGRTFVKGQWPAIVPDAQFLAVNRIISDPSRKVSKPGRGVHLLSMTAKCDVCGGPLAARIRRDRGQPELEEYRCHQRACVSIPKADLDEFAESEMLAVLADDAAYARFAAHDAADDQALAVAEIEVETIANEMRAIERQVEALEMPATSAGRILVGLETRLKAAEARARALRTPPQLSSLIEPGEDVAERWIDAPMAVRRTVARLMLSTVMLGELRVTRSPIRGHRVPVGDRIVWGKR